jgi:outer membrane protein
MAYNKHGRRTFFVDGIPYIFVVRCKRLSDRYEDGLKQHMRISVIPVERKTLAKSLMVAAWSVVLLFVVQGLTGCATVRRAREVQKDRQPPPGERTVTAAEVGLTSNSVLNLQDALRIALTSQPAVAQARLNLEAVSAQLQQSRSAYAPTVDARAGYQRGTSNTDSELADNDTENSYSGSIGLDWLIYDFGKTPAVVRQAYERQSAAVASLKAARNNAAFNVRTAFFTLAQNEALLTVAEEAVQQFREHLNQAIAFMEVGRRTQYDVTKAEVDLGNAQLELIAARNAVRTARVGLNRSLGLAEDPGYRLGELISIQVSTNLDELMTLARQQHPELLALKAQERVAFAAVDEAIANLYPSLSLQAQYGATGSQFPLVWNWFGALQSGVQLFSGRTKTGKIDEAVARLRIARAQVADREQQIYQDLETALSQLSSAQQRLALTELILRQAQESLDLVAEQYRIGRASSVDVTDAQVAVTRAKADQVQARFQYQTAVAQIRHTVGEE